MDAQQTGPGDSIEGNVGDGGENVAIGKGIDQRHNHNDAAPTQNIYAARHGDNWGLWLADIKTDLVEMRAEQRQRFGNIESELRTQDRHLGKMAGDVAELKEMRHGVSELRHVVNELARQVNLLMQMEPELREDLSAQIGEVDQDFKGQLRELRQNFSFHINLMWLVMAGLMVALMILYFRG